MPGRKSPLEMVMGLSETNTHKARMPRPHLGTELAERNVLDQAEDVCRQLFPHLQKRVMYPKPKEK